MIIGAAIQSQHNEKLYWLPKPNRHGDVIRHMVDSDKHPKPVRGIQGFVTNTGEFLNREQAYEYAKAKDQILPGTGIRGVLYSEDLW